MITFANRNDFGGTSGLLNYGTGLRESILTEYLREKKKQTTTTRGKNIIY